MNSRRMTPPVHTRIVRESPRGLIMLTSTALPAHSSYKVSVSDGGGIRRTPTSAATFPNRKPLACNDSS